MACACSSGLTVASLQWLTCAPPLAHARRSLASSASQMLTLDARLRAAAPVRASVRRRASTRAMALPTPTDADYSSFALAATVTGALTFVVFRAIVYFRMQYFIAQLLGRHVPRGGARVLDLGIREGRNLYYYPEDAVQVVAVSSNPDKNMLENQAVNAKVPIRIVPDFSKIPANSMDAVVSVYGMAELSDEEITSTLSDAVRTLKPGKKFIYVENVGSDNVLTRAFQQLIESIGKLVGSKYRVTRDVLPFVQKTEGLGDLKYETLLGFQDPHLVGIAIKQGVEKEKAPKKERAPKKGFAPQKIEFPGQ